MTANLEIPKMCESNQNNEESIVTTILSATEKILSEPPTSELKFVKISSKF